jgi:hypothetical protein
MFLTCPDWSDSFRLIKNESINPNIVPKNKFIQMNCMQKLNVLFIKALNNSISSSVSVLPIVLKF